MCINISDSWSLALAENPGPILESKGMHAIFQKKGKKEQIFGNLGKNVQNLKTFWKRAVSNMRLLHAWNS